MLGAFWSNFGHQILRQILLYKSDTYLEVSGTGIVNTLSKTWRSRLNSSINEWRNIFNMYLLIYNTNMRSYSAQIMENINVGTYKFILIPILLRQSPLHYFIIHLHYDE